MRFKDSTPDAAGALQAAFEGLLSESKASERYMRALPRLSRLWPPPLQRYLPVWNALPVVMAFCAGLAVGTPFIATLVGIVAVNLAPKVAPKLWNRYCEMFEIYRFLGASTRFPNWKEIAAITQPHVWPGDPHSAEIDGFLMSVRSGITGKRLYTHFLFCAWLLTSNERFAPEPQAA